MSESSKWRHRATLSIIDPLFLLSIAFGASFAQSSSSMSTFAVAFNSPFRRKIEFASTLTFGNSYLVLINGFLALGSLKSFSVAPTPSTMTAAALTQKSAASLTPSPPSLGLLRRQGATETQSIPFSFDF